MGALQTRSLPTAKGPVPSVVVLVDNRRAIVAARDQTGRISTSEIGRTWRSESAFLAQVISRVGDSGRVVVLGPSSARLALEREYVAISHRPDRLVDLESGVPTSAEELVDRLYALAA
jgi:hypothetical protein